MFEKNKKQDSTEVRPIDNLVDEFVPRWKRTIIYMKKTQVKTWQGAIILAFVGGLCAAAIWIARFDAGIFSESAGASATLSLKSGSSNTLTVAQGANFSVDVILNTNSSNVVAVNAIVQYNTTNFQLVGAPNISASIFNNAGDNACVSQAQAQSKRCNIIDTTTAGKVSIAMAKPTTGVNTAAGKIATLTFKALKAISANTTDIKINFVAVGNYTDSDVIFDDGNGTDILQSASSFTIAVTAPNVATVVSPSVETPVAVNSPASTISAPTVQTESSKSHHKKETKKKKKTMKVINSPSTVQRGSVLVQHGAYFTKKSKVLVYFGNGRGGYLPPKTVYTNASGKFSIAYRANKLPGKYSWYAVVASTGKKSNVATYAVK